MDLIAKMTQYFNYYVKNMNIYANTKPQKGSVQKQETRTKIPNKLNKRYHIAIGSLLYLMKHP